MASLSAIFVALKLSGGVLALGLFAIYFVTFSKSNSQQSDAKTSSQKSFWTLPNIIKKIQVWF